MSAKVSIYDVANEVGVSPATVSYVINGKGKVSESTKKKIIAAMKRVGYTPNNAAISLSTGKSRLVGVCLPYGDASNGFVNNPFYAEFIGSFQKEMSSRSYDVVMGSIRSEKLFCSWVKSRGLDALVLFGLYSNKILGAIKKLKIPCVLVDVYNDKMQGFTNVRVNDYLGSYLATNYLIEQGHKDIGFVSGTVESILDQKRYDGFKKAMFYHGYPVKDELVFHTATTLEGGEEAAIKLLPKLKEMTALVCDADIIAIGVIRKLQELKVSIPDQLSIIGFDDISAAKYIYPSLTTIRQDISEKGRLSARAILSELDDGNAATETIVIEPKIVVRDSVKKLKL